MGSHIGGSIGNGYRSSGNRSAGWSQAGRRNGKFSCIPESETKWPVDAADRYMVVTAELPNVVERLGMVASERIAPARQATDISLDAVEV